MWCPRCGRPTSENIGYCLGCRLPTTPPRRRSWAAWLAGLVCVLVAGTVGVYLLVPDSASPWSVDEWTRYEAVSPDVSTIDSIEAWPKPAPADEKPDFPALFSELSTGVVPVYAVTCDGTGSGTGFLVAPTTVVTAAHVIEGAAAVAVQVDGIPFAARVTGLDTAADLAVIELGRNASGRVLTFAESDPGIEQNLAALGYPLNEPLRMTEGTVLKRDHSESVDGKVLNNLIETDIVTQPGNSGGPLIDARGQVAGVVIAGPEAPVGPTLAVQVTEVKHRLANMPSPRPVSCDSPPLGPPGEDPVLLPDAADTRTTEIAYTLAQYFGGINNGDYASAYDQLSPTLQGKVSYAEFSQGVSTSYDYDFQILDADLGSDHAQVWLTFTSLQDPALGPDGASCTLWSLDYEFRRIYDGRFLIEQVTGHENNSGYRTCN
ncbi:S1C family serine protease [Amycolatopsis palatopharyngis]|uniref:S1C family serine protease n=1 Tax=Amycolatopsis palatopharyngis TaxID=187982 RepID=UPI000E243DE6|nr:serine protease [Amycolatopsis palatopharyngis]